MFFRFTPCSAHVSASVIALSDSPCEKIAKWGDLYDFERGQTTTAQMTAALNCQSSWWPCFHKNCPTWDSLLQLLNLWILKVMLRCGTTSMPGHHVTRNAWYDQLSRRRRSSRCFLHQEEFTLRACYQECLVATVKYGGGSLMVWADISRYCVGSFITFHDRTTAREYVKSLSNQVHPMFQTIFPNSDAVF
jgi:hypothetical protein